MKLGIFTDLHLGVHKNSPMWHEVALDWCDWFVSELKKRGIKEVAFLGDFFHKRDQISVNTLHVASKLLKKLKDFNLHIILGNHDLFFKNDPVVSGVNLFDGYPNITIYTKPRIVQFGSKSCCFCGWGYNPLDYRADILFTHAEINSFSFESNKRCENDLKCSDLLMNYKRIFAGHFHTKQKKESSDGILEYIGSPFCMTFSDENVEKQILVLDTESGDTEYVMYKNSPRFVTSLLSEMVELESTIDLQKSIHGSFFRLKVDCPISVQDLNEIQRLIWLCEPAELKTENLSDESFMVRKKNLSAFDVKDAIVEYIKTLNLSEEEKVIEKLMDLYEKTLEQ